MLRPTVARIDAVSVAVISNSFLITIQVL